MHRQVQPDLKIGDIVEICGCGYEVIRDYIGCVGRLYEIEKTVLGGYYLSIYCTGGCSAGTNELFKIDKNCYWYKKINKSEWDE